jgi:hypothetical protein
MSDRRERGRQGKHPMSRPPTLNYETSNPNGTPRLTIVAVTCACAAITMLVVFRLWVPGGTLGAILYVAVEEPARELGDHRSRSYCHNVVSGNPDVGVGNRPRPFLIRGDGYDDLATPRWRPTSAQHATGNHWGEAMIPRLFTFVTVARPSSNWQLTSDVAAVHIRTRL